MMGMDREDFQPAPVFVREVGGYVVTHDGAGYQVDGRLASWVERDDVPAYMGEPLPAGFAGAVLIWERGRKVAIRISSAEHEATAPERARYAAWVSELQRKRAHWDGMNENGEGFNPYR